MGYDSFFGGTFEEGEVQIKGALASVGPAQAVAVITTEEELGIASMDLARLRKARKAAETKFKELKAPFEEGVKRLKAIFEAAIAPYKAEEDRLEKAIMEFRRAAVAKAEREQELLSQQNAKAVEQAKANGLPAELHPVARVVEPPAQGFAGQEGTTSFVKVPTWVIEDESKVPLEMMIDGEMVRLWDINGPAITKIRKRYGDKVSPIPGVRFTYEETVKVR